LNESLEVVNSDTIREVKHAAFKFHWSFQNFYKLYESIEFFKEQHNEQIWSP